MSWTASEERNELLGYELKVAFSRNGESLWWWEVSPLTNKVGSAAGRCETREKAMQAAEEVAKCLARNSP